jgi:hypothetical protein
MIIYTLLFIQLGNNRHDAFWWHDQLPILHINLFEVHIPTGHEPGDHATLVVNRRSAPVFAQG